MWIYWSTGDRDAARRLIEGSLYIVTGAMQDFSDAAFKMADDLVQAGNLGLMIAIVRFDGSRGVSFRRYAKFWVRKEMLDLFKEKYDRAGDVKFDLEPLGDDTDASYIWCEDALSDDQRDRLQQLIDQLPDRERATIRMHYGLEDGVQYPLRQIAKSLGVSDVMAGNYHRKALKVLYECW